jgi:hypothetical protein
MGPGNRIGPLDGLPIAINDNIENAVPMHTEMRFEVEIDRPP